MPLHTDQLYRSVLVPVSPKRIISLVPSQTELLFYMGLNAEIAGITKFCIHPSAKVAAKLKVGGTKQLNLQAIHTINPDLIIGNKEENEQSQIEELMRHYPVWISDIDDLPGALRMISSVGAITGRVSKANELVKTITMLFDRFIRPETDIKTAYLIWRKPYMAAGRGTFINSMMEFCGFKNVFNIPRYPMVSSEELINADPQLVLLSSEPYPFAEKHIAEIRAMLPNAKIILVDGEIFSWYGSRLLEAPAYFDKLIKRIKF